MTNLKQKGLHILKGLSLLVTIAIVILSVKFADSYNFKVQKPFVYQQMILLEAKNSPISQVIAAIVVEPTPTDLDSNEAYICKVFQSQCREALEVQHLEDGNEQCDRMHINIGKDSQDYGLLQVDSQHIGQVIDGHTITLAELVTCKANVDDAYLIWKYSGWGAWSTWNLIPANLK